MSVALQADFFADHAWMIGEDALPSTASPAARYQQETRIAAAMFKRRWRLLVHFRRQSQERRSIRVQMGRRPASKRSEPAVVCNLPAMLPVLREEIALLRGFLALEIDNILFGDA